jgi:hypothetical protein
MECIVAHEKHCASLAMASMSIQIVDDEARSGSETYSIRSSSCCMKSFVSQSPIVPSAILKYRQDGAIVEGKVRKKLSEFHRMSEPKKVEPT